MEPTIVWYLDPRFLGPFVTAMVALALGVANLWKQGGRDIREISIKRDEADIKAGGLALDMAKETRSQLIEEKARSEALQERVELLEACVTALVAQLRALGHEPVSCA